MDWIISTTVFLSVLKAALCFNIDPVAWKSLNNRAAGFGYQVVQRQSNLLVSAPLEQYSSNQRGKIFACSTESCKELSVPAPDFAVNMSLGLTMTSDPTTQNTLVCGPTIPKDCKSITLYNGICFEISKSNSVGKHIPSSDEECPVQADIAFLLDGSGSVNAEDFITMKDFVKNLIRSFLTKDTQFAIAQFSTDAVVHYYFNTFKKDDWENQINKIKQRQGGTYTARAIRYVVNEVFSESRSRKNVRKVLIVITDGESNDPDHLVSAVKLAQDRDIFRFAIGVGNAFIRSKALNELKTIASYPPESNVFQAKDFAALHVIQTNLQEKIFAIEGSQTKGQLLKMEMAQMGFSAHYVPQGIQMSVVGANEWMGGYRQYTNDVETGSYNPMTLKSDSYLGYSMAVAKIQSKRTLTIVGAPRYQHRGVVMSVFENVFEQKIDGSPWQFQIGEYFGAVVGTMDVDGDGFTDLVLISAPMHMDSDREGRVYVCSLSNVKIECRFNSPLVLRGDAFRQARFGSSLAVLPDLNRDGLNDLAVGAPLENDGQGSIYIFHGDVGGRINPIYSQRIASSEVRPGLKFFGMSISQSSFDLSNDKLPDLAVGSKGTVVLLRSKPIVMVEAEVTFDVNQIPTPNSDSADCLTPLENKANICFTMTKHSPVDTARAIINYTLTLDATRQVPNNRAYIQGKQREQTGSITLDFRPQCFSISFRIKACPEDALNPLNNEFVFTFDGLPSDSNLSPSLSQQAQTTSFHPLSFQVNCGTDKKCIDNLEVDFNFNRSSAVRVGIDELLEVIVSVENSEENSYNSRVILTYPVGLSYRKFTALQGRIECSSLDSGTGLTQGRTDCTIDKPIFRSNTKALFIVSYGIESNSQLDRRIFIAANATSGNQEHSKLSKPYKRKGIDVKYSIFVTIESSLSYSNFSFGNNRQQKPVQQSIVVTNDIRELNFTVEIRVPVKLGDKDIWVDSDSLQIQNCQIGKDEQPTVTDFVAQIQKNKSVDCSVARCRVFKCNQFMASGESKRYDISANLSSEWIEQIGLNSAKFLLTSTASLEYDRNQYIFFSTGSNNNPPIRKIEAEVEVYPEPDFTKQIIGGSLGGLALLALLTAGLYKAGFFKSKYKNMMNEQDTGGDVGVEEE